MKRKIQEWGRWLQPGLGVKRWLGLIFLGITFLAVGFALFALDVYRKAPDTWWLPVLSFLSLRPLPRLVRVLIFGSLGVSVVLWGIIQLNQSLLGPYLRPGHPVVEQLTEYRRRKNGPRIVAIGGGHGLATLLRGLKKYSHNIYAVVTVADDGGSSGRLRETLGILPPGDIRNCLAALSDDEDLLTHLFQYRFSNGDQGLHGHSFGNLFISSLAQVTGSFEQAIAESGRVLAVHGRVFPSTLQNVRLIADVLPPDAAHVIRVEGESQIPKTPGIIQRVWLNPSSPPAFPAAIQAILSADMIVIGPGSLYTSIIPNLLVDDLTAAIRVSRALKVYVCNVATQVGETEGFSCEDHLRVLEKHLGEDFFDLVVANNTLPDLPDATIDWVRVEEGSSLNIPLHQTDLVDQDQPWRHHADKLAKTLIRLLEERTGPLTL